MVTSDSLQVTGTLLAMRTGLACMTGNGVITPDVLALSTLQLAPVAQSTVVIIPAGAAGNVPADPGIACATGLLPNATSSPGDLSNSVAIASSILIEPPGSVSSRRRLLAAAAHSSALSALSGGARALLSGNSSAGGSSGDGGIGPLLPGALPVTSLTPLQAKTVAALTALILALNGSTTSPPAPSNYTLQMLPWLSALRFPAVVSSRVCAAVSGTCLASFATTDLALLQELGALPVAGPTPVPTPSPASNAGAIAGGVIGGLIAAALIVVGAVWLVRERRRRRAAALASGPVTTSAAVKMGSVMTPKGDLGAVSGSNPLAGRKGTFQTGGAVPTTATPVIRRGFSAFFKLPSPQHGRSAATNSVAGAGVVRTVTSDSNPLRAPAAVAASRRMLDDAAIADAADSMAASAAMRVALRSSTPMDDDIVSSAPTLSRGVSVHSGAISGGGASTGLAAAAARSAQPPMLVNPLAPSSSGGSKKRLTASAESGGSSGGSLNPLSLSTSKIDIGALPQPTSANPLPSAHAVGANTGSGKKRKSARQA